MKRFDAIIFDMDGVIVDSEPHHERAFLDVFQDLGYGETHGIHFPSYYGKSDLVLWEDFVARHRPSQSLEELVGLKQRRLIDVLRREQPVFETLPELVEKLGRVYALGLASGSMHVVIDEVLAMKDLRRHFQAIVSSQDVKRGKPAPDIFLYAASRLGVAPERCCVIEDSVAGIEAGRAAGMQVIAITNTFPRERLHRAHHVVRLYEEIEQILLPSAERGSERGTGAD